MDIIGKNIDESLAPLFAQVEEAQESLDRLERSIRNYHDSGCFIYLPSGACDCGMSVDQDALAALATVREALEQLRAEREGYKRDFLAALERSEIQETRLRALQEAVSEYIAYPTLAGRRERLELILADLNPDGGSKGFSGGA